MKLIHNNEIIIAVVTNDVSTPRGSIGFQGTPAECRAEAIRLSLIDRARVFSTVSEPSVAPVAPAPRSAPAKRRVINARDFMLRFTVAEYTSAKASTNPSIIYFLSALEMGEPVDLSASTTTEGVNYAAYIGLIAPERVAQILA